MRHLCSQSRCATGTFSSAINIEAQERFVFDHETGNGNSLRDRLLPNLAIPFASNLSKRQTAIKLLQNNPDHDARAFERGLPAANFGIRDDMPSQFDSTPFAIGLGF